MDNEFNEPAGPDSFGGEDFPYQETSTDLVKHDPQLETARKEGLTWMFEGTEYPLFLANKTGNVTAPIMHPTSGRQIAAIGADFMWEQSQPFLDHLNIQIRDERNAREDESIRKRANMTRLNATLFDALVQRGQIIKIDEFGDTSEPEDRDRQAMLTYLPEVKSQVINDWLGNFHVERYFPAGTEDIDAMLSNVDTVWFLAKIGDFKSPAHALLLEFASPSPDARRSFEDDSSFLGTKREGDRVIETYNIKQNNKLNFAKKYFRSVQGAVLGPVGDVEPSTSSLVKISAGDDEAMKSFKSNFNPHWWIRLANQLGDAFNFTGK